MAARIDLCAEWAKVNPDAEMNWFRKRKKKWP